MAIKPFNSVDGISVGNTSIDVVYANGDVSASNLVVSGTSNLGPVGNITITGGTPGQVLTTDGAGNLSFTTATGSSNSAAPMPYLIPNGESYIVPENFQGLFFQPIDIEGEFEVDGVLIDVSGGSNGGGGNGTPGGSNTQIQYNNNGAFAGDSSFTFVSGVVTTPNISVAGNIIPTANVTYSLGNDTNRFSNLYLAGNTIVLGDATISANATSLVFTNPSGGNFILNASSNSNTASLNNGNSNIIVTANGNINMAVAGNANLLRLSGTGFYSNSTSVQYKAPLINQGGNPNGAPLSSNDGKDRGSLLNYYSTFPATAFMGWDNSNGEFTLASEVTATNDEVTVYQLGNVRAGYIFGNVIGNISGNFTVAGVNTQVIFNDEGIANGAAGFTYNKTNNAVSVANTFTAYGSITGANLSTAGDLSVTGNGTMGTITSYGEINAVSTITGGNFYSGGTIQTVGTATFGDIQTGGDIAATGNITGGNMATTGNLNVSGNATFGGNLMFLSANYANFTGNLTVGSASSGIVLRPNGYARVRGLEVYSTSNTDGNITSRLITTTWANATTLTVSGDSDLNNVSASTGNFSGNITSLNANLGNLATANFFSGDGHLLTNITVQGGTAIVNGNSDVSVAPNANVTISANGFSNVVTVTGTNTIFGSNVTINNNVIVSGSVYSNVIRDGVASMTIDGGSGTWIAFDVSGSGNSFVINDTGVNVFGYANITGSSTVAGNSSITGNLSVSGNTTVANISASKVTGTSSTITGNITAGNISGGNLVSANFFSGDGYLLSNLTIAGGTSIINGNSNVNVALDANVTITAEGNANVVTVTGNSVIFDKQISAPLATLTTINAGTVNATTVNANSSLTINGNITANGYANVDTLRVRQVDGNLGTATIEGNLRAQANLFVSGYSNVGTINAGTVNVSGSIDANNTVHGNYITATFDITASRDLIASDDISAGGNLSITGNTTLHKTNVIGNLTASNIDGGNLISANYFSGDGYLLSNLTVTGGTSLVNGTSNVIVIANGNVVTSVGGNDNVFVVTSTGANIAGTIRATGNANVNNIGAGIGVFTGNVSATNLSASGNITGGGTLTVPGTANTGAINSTGAISATGNITSLNANLGNLVTANFFTGDGYLLTNLTIPTGTAILNGNSNVLVTYSSDVNITAGGVANVLKVANTGATVTGSLDVTGNINGLRFSNGSSNISIVEDGAVIISAEGNNQILRVTGIGANVYGTFRSIGNTVVSGNANINNIGVSGLVDVAGNITGGNLNTGGKLSIGGNANVANLGTTGFITATGNISGGNLLTSGSLTVSSGGAGIVGDTNITGNLGVTGNFTVTGNLNYQNVTDLVVGDPLIYIGNDNTGDLVDLGFIVSFDDGLYQHGGMARDHIDGVWKFFSNVVAEPTTVIDFANAIYDTVKMGGLITTGNANIAGVANITGNVTAPYFIGNVVGNITGNVSAPGTNTQVMFNDGGTIAGAAGVTFDKTSNSLTVVGNITSATVIGGNLVTANYLTGTLTTSAQPNITSTGTLTGLVSTGTVNLSGASNISLGSVSNIKISGGSANYVLSTDGVGNLSWAAQTGGGGGGGGGTGGYVTQTFTGNGVQTTVTVNSGTTANSAIVTENGILQTPDTDYTVSGTTLTFATAPATGVLVQIRELSMGGAVGGGTNQVFQVNEQAVTANYTIPTGKSASSVGPITISDGIAVTVPTGSRWVIL